MTFEYSTYLRLERNPFLTQMGMFSLKATWLNCAADRITRLTHNLSNANLSSVLRTRYLIYRKGVWK